MVSCVQGLAAGDGFKLVLAIDDVRDAIYAGKPLESYEVAKLNRLAAEVAAELQIPCLDLHATFAAHYARNQQRFEFAYDWHWNALANQLVGAEIARFLLRDPGICAASHARPTPASRTARLAAAQERTPWLSSHSTRAVVAA
jgi:hypothetical protein